MDDDRPGAGEAFAQVLFAALLWWLVTLAGDVMYGLGLWPIGALLRILALVFLGGAIFAIGRFLAALFR